jgi:hypothetical protein
MNQDLFEAGISFAVTMIEKFVSEGGSLEDILERLKRGK